MIFATLKGMKTNGICSLSFKNLKKTKNPHVLIAHKTVDST